MVVCDQGEIVEFIVVDIEGESFFDVLFYELIDDSERFSATWTAYDDTSSERIDDVDPTLMPPFPIVELDRQIYGIFVQNQTGFLLKRFVFGVVHVIRQTVFQQSAGPYSGSQQTKIADGERRDINDGFRIERQAYPERDAAAEKKYRSERSHSRDARPCDRSSTNTSRSEARKR